MAAAGRPQIWAQSKERARCIPPLLPQRVVVVVNCCAALCRSARLTPSPSTISPQKHNYSTTCRCLGDEAAPASRAVDRERGGGIVAVAVAVACEVAVDDRERRRHRCSLLDRGGGRAAASQHERERERRQRQQH